MLEYFRNHPALQALRAAEHFPPVGGWALGVDFDDCSSLAEYARVRDWCRSNCAGKWRCEPDRLSHRSVFRFEVIADAVLFGLSTRNVTPWP